MDDLGIDLAADGSRLEGKVGSMQGHLYKGAKWAKPWLSSVLGLTLQPQVNPARSPILTPITTAWPWVSGREGATDPC